MPTTYFFRSVKSRNNSQPKSHDNNSQYGSFHPPSYDFQESRGNSMNCNCSLGELCISALPHKFNMRSNSYYVALLYFFYLLSVVTSASFVFDQRSYKCNDASRYADGSTYSINMKRVMDYLVQSTSLAGFGTYSYGQSPNKVYGVLQCIGNITQEHCQSCSKEAESRFLDNCSNNIGGQAWLDYCYVRFSNSSFFSEEDTDAGFIQNSNPVRPQVRNITIRLISDLADITPCKGGFASNSSSYILSNAVFDRVYGTAQCWREMPINGCHTCLISAARKLESCCSGNIGGQALLGNCTIRFELYPFYFSDENPPTPSPAGDNPESSAHQTSSTNSKKSSKRLAIILGIIGSLILGTVTVCIFAMRKKMPSLIPNKQIALARDNEDAPQKMLFNKEQIVFSLKALMEATAGFSSINKLGEGGFGSVYKGVLQDGQEIAVKKLSTKSGQGTREFMTEVKIVSNIQHRNLVNLLGCCVEGDERLLVYEFLPNKSLDTFLFDLMKCRQLDWQKRYNIIIGIARLLYLHQDSKVRIIHRDIKANNILLDHNLNPKIADFGLARLFPDNETEIQSRVAGTYGYMAPEYAMRGHLSVKADVYSFGVLLLEIVSGRKNTDIELLMERQISSLVEWAWRLYKRGNVLSMVDGAVAETCSEEQASRCIQVRLLCTQADADVRPFMSTVVLMLISNSEPLPHPKKPAFVSLGQSPSVSAAQNSSLTSITVVEAR